MYCIAILTDQEQEGQKSAEYIRNYCTEKHVFPLIEIYQKQEQFFCTDIENSTDSGVSRITGCVRPECSRTPSFSVSEMWNYLVQ